MHSEWACAIFCKSWEELHSEVEVEVNIVETEEERAALARAVEQTEHARLADEKSSAVEATRVAQELAADQTRAELAAEEAKVVAKIAADEAVKKKKADDIEAAKKGSGAVRWRHSPPRPSSTPADPSFALRGQSSRMKQFNMMAEADTTLTPEQQVKMEAQRRRCACQLPPALASRFP